MDGTIGGPSGVADVCRLAEAAACSVRAAQCRLSEAMRRPELFSATAQPTTQVLSAIGQCSTQGARRSRRSASEMQQCASLRSASNFRSLVNSSTQIRPTLCIPICGEQHSNRPLLGITAQHGVLPHCHLASLLVYPLHKHHPNPRARCRHAHYPLHRRLPRRLLLACSRVLAIRYRRAPHARCRCACPSCRQPPRWPPRWMPRHQLPRPHRHRLRAHSSCRQLPLSLLPLALIYQGVLARAGGGTAPEPANAK